MRYFQTRFLKEADEFISGLEVKAIKKLLYNVDLAEQTNDPKLFKKLREDVWEFRVRHGNIQLRLLAFWDKSDNSNTLVFATHGVYKES